ncbi:hypothetical protein AB0M41_39195 [Streptomyces sp. NPDC051896]|uniref:hypothetical protein n=1 Tax=Streptomyces sp. NPDC051896 TaxID=3155416 RepID=UPI0034394B42
MRLPFSNRIKIRVRTAMSSQARLQGRYLGGRPPYGYRIILETARFVCTVAECARRTFVQQVDGLTERYARRPPPM